MQPLVKPRFARAGPESWAQGGRPGRCREWVV